MTSNNTNSSVDGSYTVRDKYQKSIDYEQILFNQMNRIAQFRSNKDVDHYEFSIDTLIFMLPHELREKVLEYKHNNNIDYNTTKEGVIRYDDLWRFVNSVLEESNLIFRTSYIKTYE